MSDEAWEQARHKLRERHAQCLATIAERYGHDLPSMAPEVMSAVAALARASFDLGVEFAHKRSTIPPPPPSDAELLAVAVPKLRPLSG